MSKKNLKDPSALTEAQKAGLADGARAETLIGYLQALGVLVGTVSAGGAEASVETMSSASMLHGELIEELSEIIFPEGKGYVRFGVEIRANETVF